MYLKKRKTAVFLVLCFILYGSVLLSGCMLQHPAPDQVSSGTTPDFTSGINPGVGTISPTTLLSTNKSVNPSPLSEDTPVPPIATTPSRI